MTKSTAPEPRLHRVWIPALVRELTGGREIVEVSGDTVCQVIEELERLHPGIKERLCSGDNVRPGMAVFVNAQVAPLGLLQLVEPGSEIHFLPAIGGG
jgi:molybdopterin synthase sulfur carrier subunit